MPPAGYTKFSEGERVKLIVWLSKLTQQQINSEKLREAYLLEQAKRMVGKDFEFHRIAPIFKELGLTPYLDPVEQREKELRQPRGRFLTRIKNMEERISSLERQLGITTAN